MAQQISILNRALTLLGEDTIPGGTSEIVDPYLRMLNTACNMIREEVEDSWEWRALNAIAIQTDPVVGNGWVQVSNTNARSRIMRHLDYHTGFEQTAVADVTDGDWRPLVEIDQFHMQRLYAKEYAEGGSTTDKAEFFSTQPKVVDDWDGALYMRVFPTPQTIRTYSISTYNPQSTVGNSSIDEYIKVPETPIVLGLYWWALEERGEELGTKSTFAEERYRKALDSAIALDQNGQGDLDLIPV